ncbi:hypothetical protein EDD18DRAFT_529441 [Armillaria luteobubalina]|uniref:Heterokaryon incompatibility domain-containing protein n=1 Tax=Armillaria luteobubalina TaxID=153913 RepID=A0AA39PWJ2_9AGAR|nr:hypothetical protein EDD18DRAFT_529441 [Armillaria luteobubalina]
MNRQEWYDRYTDDVNGTSHGRKDDKKMRRKYGHRPWVTLSAFTEAGMPEPSISVLKQQTYTGRYPVISSSLADTPCTSLDVEGILGKLNTILRTSYTREIRSLSSLIETYILKDYDFGTAFSRLSPFWYNDLTDIEDKLHSHEAWDRQMRQDVLVNNKIISRLLPPRRVWDLYSNRVVPWWVARRYPSAISHAWMEEEDRTDVQTPINGYEWPVPMPKDANLDLIRIEMLNHGAEYAWLDVLCLRQVGGRREDLRAEEWKGDVPTIGHVYSMSHNGVVCYLSGLGRPFSLKEEDFKSGRCWFRRAWTLQEIHPTMIIGGETGGDRIMEKKMRARIENQLSWLRENIEGGGLGRRVFFAFSEMQKRVSTNPLDKVAGLSYLLRTDEIPAYYASQLQDEAWAALVDEMGRTYRANMFFLYPKAGNGKKYWRPSWKQAMTEELPQPHLMNGWVGFVQRTKDNDADWYDGPCIESCHVRGLGENTLKRKCREGELLVEDTTGGKHTFMVVAAHRCLLPEGLYTLVGSDLYNFLGRPQERQCWVVGERLLGKMFKKLSVLMMAKDEVKRLDDLGVATKTKTFLA